jgi:hypothetical protein
MRSDSLSACASPQEEPTCWTFLGNIDPMHAPPASKPAAVAMSLSKFHGLRPECELATAIVNPRSWIV